MSEKRTRPDVHKLKLIEVYKRQYVLRNSIGHNVSPVMFCDTEEEARNAAEKWCSSWRDFVLDGEIIRYGENKDD